MAVRTPRTGTWCTDVMMTVADGVVGIMTSHGTILVEDWKVAPRWIRAGVGVVGVPDVSEGGLRRKRNAPETARFLTGY